MVLRCSRRRFLEGGPLAIGLGIAGCASFRSTGTADVTVVNLTEAQQRVSVRLLRGEDELVWQQRVDLPAREPNEGPAVETTNALQEVKAGATFTVEVRVDGVGSVTRAPFSIDCTGDNEFDDGVFVRILPNGRGGEPYADIRESTC